ncbi:unnamed protein product [Laminaria digitata]
MMQHDLYAEGFHRDIVIQEEAQKRRKLVEKYEGEIRRLREQLEAALLEYNNDKIRMRWEHADEV